MRTIPSLHWNRRHNLAALWVSFARSLWDPRELDDAGLILGYNATGRLARVLVLDPRRVLPRGATTRDALAAVLRLVERRDDVAPRELAVLHSAFGRSAGSGLDDVDAVGA